MKHYYKTRKQAMVNAKKDQIVFYDTSKELYHLVNKSEIHYWSWENIQQESVTASRFPNSIRYFFLWFESKTGMSFAWFLVMLIASILILLELKRFGVIA